MSTHPKPSKEASKEHPGVVTDASAMPQVDPQPTHPQELPQSPKEAEEAEDHSVGAKPSKPKKAVPPEAKPATKPTAPHVPDETPEGKPPQNVEETFGGLAAAYERTAEAASKSAVQEPATHLDFGKSGKLKIEAAGPVHYGIAGQEMDITVRISDTETVLLRAMPAKLLV